MKQTNMTIKWSESSTVKLVVLYGRHECLRNPLHPDFNKQLCCYRAYKQIVYRMNIPGLTVCDCVKRISFVKKQYCFELSKISAAISRGSFYKPKVSWFEMMHELLFPYIQSEFDFNEDIRKECDCSQDEEGNGDRSDNKNQEIDECECPPCECPLPVNTEQEPEPEINTETCLDSQSKKHHCSKSRSSKNRGSSKSPSRTARSNHIERDCTADMADKRPKLTPRPKRHERIFNQNDHGTSTKRITCDKGHEGLSSTSATIFSQRSAQCIDTENRLSSPYVSQATAQTERKNVTNNYTSYEHAEKGQCTMNCELSTEDVCVGGTEDRGRKYKHHDEFDMFGKSIACQLRSLNLKSAINLEKRIQDMMTQERLNCIKDSTVVKSYSKECSCDYNDCKDCCDSEKDQLCACGIPVSKCLPSFPIKTSQCYGFGCS